MATYSSWIHGNSVVPQDHATAAKMANVGWAAHFKYDPFHDNPEQYFHFHIPTPTVEDDKRTHLDRVMLLFRTTQSAKIDRVDLWDGAVLKSSHQVNFHGEHNNGIKDGENIVNVEGNPELAWGLGVSLHVMHGADDAEVEFVGAGADFHID